MEEGHDVKASLSIYMQTQDIISYTYMIKNTKVPLDCLKEPGGFNIFHEIATSLAREQNLLQFLEILISEFHDRYFDEASEKIKNMINALTKQDKQTPLLMAIRHNRKKIVKKFVELGAETLVKNIYGQNPLHIAAECGFENILVYLCRELYMDFSSTDINGRTPLHIAALEGQINTGILLISWSDNLNLQDIEGFTPLHLAVLSQNYKLVRNLIIRDADTKIKDSKDETAFDIALNRGVPDIIKILKPMTCTQRLNPFYIPIGPVQNSYMKFIIYILLFIFRAGLTIVVIMPHLNKILSISAAAILILTAFSFIIVNIKDPGYTKNTKNLNLSTLYETYRSEYICAYCETRKPKFARHCHYCERCVKDFDHHCPWIHNCVGQNNHSWFVFFITFSVIDYLMQGLLGIFDYFKMFQGRIMNFYELPEERIAVSISIAFINFACLLIVVPIFYLQLRVICENRESRSRASSKASMPEDIVENKSVVEMSDTASMFIRQSEDWNPKSISNQVSFFTTKVKSTNNLSCCQANTRSIY
ncbi:hypothetical protein SteCoe_28783 [Stentor coeruleus]|uniref:Palmitoyltransferase n=1 Tax=Stentor coeruleus TaxID=5963 RepID=A0A1R2B7J2_9CILI|nr:hypothetical protein SteCoe_28783 [Stentor coeruleus]